MRYWRNARIGGMRVLRCGVLTECGIGGMRVLAECAYCGAAY